MSGSPRLFDLGRMALLGRRERYALADLSSHIPAQWAWFGPRAAAILTRIGLDAFGLCSDRDGAHMSYLCGVPIASDDAPAPEDLMIVALPPLRFAAFEHHGHVSDLQKTIEEAFDIGLPRAALVPFRGVDVPDLVEHYGADFNPQTGTGPVEIWIPVGPASPAHD